MRSLALTPLLVLTFTFSAAGAEKYTGPVPPKADMLYLLHAANLLETEAKEAREEKKGDNVTAIIPGESSPVKTPLAEPIFLLKSEKLQPNKIAAYPLEVKGGNREVVVAHRRQKNVAKPIYLDITRVDEGIYRIEVDEELPNGEYTLSPEGSNQTFSFQIY